MYIEGYYLFGLVFLVATFSYAWLAWKDLKELKSQLKD